MTSIKRLLIWLKSIIIWIYDGKLFWTFICLIVVFSLFKSGYVYFGTGLQLLGIITIVIGINDKIKLFNKESPLRYHFKYFLRFPSFKAKIIELNISDAIHLMDSTNADLIQHAKKPAETLPALLSYIDEEIMHLNHQISTIRTELHEQIDTLTKQLSDQRRKIESNIQNVDKKLELSSTSNISLELFGAGCIAAGLIFSILPLL